MNRVLRMLLAAAAGAVGGGLGWLLLDEFTPLKTFVFLAACLALGYAFYEIDKRIPKG